MKAFYLLFMIAIALSSKPGMATEMHDTAGQGRVKPYFFCNVFLQDGCFGIAHGDKLTTRIIMDFVQYDIDFASGGEARLYSGFNPKLIEEDVGFKNCKWQQEFFECKSRVLKDHRLEFIARRGLKSTAIHVVFGAKVAPNIAYSFMRNIRPCTMKAEIIRCDSKQERNVTQQELLMR